MSTTSGNDADRGARALLGDGIGKAWAAASRRAVAGGAVGAGSAGALAIGALALGATAIGALAIGRLAVGSARLRRVEIDELVVGSVRIGGAALRADDPGPEVGSRAVRPAAEPEPATAGLVAVAEVIYLAEDLDDAVAWYAQRLEREPVLRARDRAAFDIHGVRLTLLPAEGRAADPERRAIACWTVVDVDAFVEEWTGHGAASCGETSTLRDMRMRQVLDPFGNVLAVRQELLPALSRTSGG